MFQANVIDVSLTPSQGLGAQEVAVFIQDRKTARTKARSHAWKAAPEPAPRPRAQTARSLSSAH